MRVLSSLAMCHLRVRFETGQVLKSPSVSLRMLTFGLNVREGGELINQNNEAFDGIKYCNVFSDSRG